LQAKGHTYPEQFYSEDTNKRPDELISKNRGKIVEQQYPNKIINAALLRETNNPIREQTVPECQRLTAPT